MVQAGEACNALRKGEKDQAKSCADQTILELTDVDQYNGAVGVLDGIGEPAVPSLVRALTSSEWLARAAAADALGRMGVRLEKRDAIVNALAAHGSDKDLRVRRQVIGALGRIGLKTTAADEAIRQAEADSDPMVRQLAGYARQRFK
jgi:HEAT repeat protein